MTDRILTQELLKELVHYDPITGLVTRKSSKYRSDRVGIEAGTKHSLGYREVKIIRVVILVFHFIN